VARMGEQYLQGLMGNRTESNHSEDLDTDDRILRWILKKWDKAWTEFIRFTRGTTSVLL
jgi:hypothetical protein